MLKTCLVVNRNSTSKTIKITKAKHIGRRITMPMSPIMDTKQTTCTKRKTTFATTITAMITTIGAGRTGDTPDMKGNSRTRITGSPLDNMEMTAIRGGTPQD